MNTQKVNIKLILLFVSLLVGFILLALLIITNRIDVLKNERYLEVSKTAKNELKTLIDEQAESVLQISLSMAENVEIKSVLLNKSDKELDLKSFSEKLRKHTSLKNVWFQVSTAEGISVYRSWTKKRGDDLKKFRLDIVKMLENPKVITSISVGKFDLTFKAIVPIVEDGKMIGIFETIAKFNSISIKMLSKGFDSIILVDKKYKQQLKKAFSKKFINDYYVANLNAKKELMDYILNQNIEHFIGPKKPFHLYEKDNKFVSFYDLKDINKQPMAYFIMFQDLNKINIDDIIQVRNNLIGIFGTIFLIIISLTYYLYNKRYKNMIETLNEELERKVIQKTKKLDHIAHHDSLTGLPNRLLFLDRFCQSIKHAKRNKENVCILFLDLDRFKEVNDSFGHDTGDKLLKIVSSRLLECVREEDTIARLGGDEFTIIIENIQMNDIKKVADKIINTMQDAVVVNESKVYVTSSIGISIYPDDGESTDILLRNADTAMYKAKSLGKNTYQFYNPEMTTASLERLMLDANIRNAIELNEFEPFFQPQVDIRNDKIIGVEALIRWESPVLGFTTPDKFIPYAEEVGLILDIDRLMMLNCIDIINRWKNNGIEIVKLSLNLSIKQLDCKDYLEGLKKVLRDTNFDPNKLELEITESQIMNDPEKSITVLNKIKELGITIAVDDFGTGYSSLSYLKRLPIDRLKIDQSFIRDIPHDEEDAAIVESIITLAKSLKLDVLAEGVETKEQKEFLLSKGCHNVQGYYYAKPMPCDQYEEFLIDR